MNKLTLRNNKSVKIGVVNPNTVKSRDLVHLQEITYGTGCGPWRKTKKAALEAQQMRARPVWWY
jgi:hypothetical protein